MSSQRRPTIYFAAKLKSEPLLVIDLVSPEKTTPLRSRRSHVNQQAQKVIKDTPKQTVTPSSNAVRKDSGGDGDGKVAFCPICFECVFKVQAASTACGHLFCRQCIVQEVQIRPKCPMCSQPLTVAQITTIYGNH